MVVEGRASGHLLETYGRERRPIAQRVVAATTAATRTVTGTVLASDTLRRRVLQPLARRLSPAPIVGRGLVGRRGLALVAQLDDNYRDGPLGRSRAALHPHGWRRGPLPGERCPDGPCHCWPGGSRSSLGAQTRGRWALLVGGQSAHQTQAAATARDRLAGDVVTLRILPSSALADPDRWAADPTVDGVLEDDRGVIVDRIRPARSEALLVRPDGYVGWRSRGARQTIGGWLDRMLDRRGAAVTGSGDG